MEITGHEEVIKMLGDLSKEDGKPIARKGLRAAAKEVVLPVVKQLAAKHRKTGNMDANLKVRPGGGGKGVVRVKIGAGKKDFQGGHSIRLRFCSGIDKGSDRRPGQSVGGSRRVGIPGRSFLATTSSIRLSNRRRTQRQRRRRK